MKTTLKLAFAAIVAGLIFIASCSKYEEGPKLSLASKKGRLAGTWVFEKYIENGVDITSSVAPFMTGAYSEFKKDGSYTYVMGSYTETGTWEFINDKEDVKTLGNTSGATPDTMHIIRLKSKELWTKETYSNGDTDEIHYVAK